MKLSKTAAIVTGSASGLGEATARILAAQGAKVALFDTNLPMAEKIAGEIGGIAIRCNVSEESDVQQAVSLAEKKHGVARILVNCAGIGASGRIVGKEGPMPLNVFEKTIRINLIGTFNMIRLVADRIIKENKNNLTENGVIISTTSAAVFEGQIGQAAYAASKGAIHSMTLPAAREFAQFGIRILTIAPGLFHTPLLGNLPEEAQQQISSSIPFPKRLGNAKEYASLALHLIENEYINGENIRIDGALRLTPK